MNIKIYIDIIKIIAWQYHNFIIILLVNGGKLPQITALPYQGPTLLARWKMVDTNKNVVTAFNQWKSRPAEERFIDIDQMQAAMTKRRERCEDVGPYSVVVWKLNQGQKIV